MSLRYGIIFKKSKRPHLGHGFSGLDLSLFPLSTAHLVLEII